MGDVWVWVWGVGAAVALCAATVAHRRAHSALARYRPTLAAGVALLAAGALCGVARMQQRTAGAARDLLRYGVLYGFFGAAALLAAAQDRAPGSLAAALGLAVPARGTGPRRARTFAAALGTGLAVAAALGALAAATAQLRVLPAAALPMALVHATFAQLFFATYLHRTLLAAFGALPALLATAAAHTAFRACTGLGLGSSSLAAAVAQQAYVSVFLAAPLRRLCAAWAAWPAVQLAVLAVDPAAPTGAALAAAAPHALTVLAVWAAVFVALAW